jgi:hypothetical protein
VERTLKKDSLCTRASAYLWTASNLSQQFAFAQQVVLHTQGILSNKATAWYSSHKHTKHGSEQAAQPMHSWATEEIELVMAEMVQLQQTQMAASHQQGANMRQ